MKSLKILHAEEKCGIDKNGILNLDLIEIYIDGNKKLTEISTEGSYMESFISEYLNPVSNV